MSSKSPPPHPEAGFTLIEILLAVAILAMVSIIVSVSFATTVRLRDAAMDNVAREHQARNTLRLMADELTVSRLHFKYRWFGRNGEEDGRPADLFAFSTAAHTRVQSNIAEADMAHVLYIREKTRLFRYSLRNPYAITAAAVDRTEIADGVLGFNVRYYSKRVGIWLDQWDEGQSAMPSGVLIELTLGNSPQSSRTYTAWVPTAQMGTVQPPLPGQTK